MAQTNLSEKQRLTDTEIRLGAAGTGEGVWVERDGQGV